jgi:hypothetical protein
MKDHFPLWFVFPTDKAGATLHDSSAPPVVFSSADKVAAWLDSRRSENYWYVRLLDRNSAIEALNDLRGRGCTEIYLDVDWQLVRTISIADLVLSLARN